MRVRRSPAGRGRTTDTNRHAHAARPLYPSYLLQKLAKRAMEVVPFAVPYFVPRVPLAGGGQRGRGTSEWRPFPPLRHVMSESGKHISQRRLSCLAEPTI